MSTRGIHRRLRMVLGFDGHELDLQRRELRAAGQRVPLQPKVFRLLAYLVEHRARVVPREELLAALWPGEIVVAGVLSTAVRALRRALGDDPRRPRFVHTAHRVGYRFLPSARELCGAPPASAAELSPVARARRSAFVGRERDVERVLCGVGDPNSAVQLLWVHGPGGIGKTSLLIEIGHELRRAGVVVSWLRPEEIAPSPAAMRRAVSAAVGCADPAHLALHGARGPLRILLLDDYHRLAHLDEWVRTVLWPELPARVRLVLASRARPSIRWRSDPAWIASASALALDRFGPDEIGRYLAARGVPADQIAPVFEVTAGHPLAVSLACDALRQRGGRFDPAAYPDLIGGLVEWFTSTAPPYRRATLE